ncbi:MAG: transcription antitermination protein NusB [Bacteroidetes bacterium]|jgi:transcription antitermination protein NusB|nr:transcription antitermination protein NusB [Bacteroidota bacterium]MDA1383084.1 transcription antitermination protein NusB [Bacteroidota bacterium]
MLNRRHLRIKILQILYGFYQDEDLDTTKAKKALDHSIDKMYQLYLLLISMIAEMQGLAIDKIEAGRKKQLPTEEDLHPNTKFVRNAALRVLANSKQLKNRLSETGVGWGKHRELLRNLHRSLIENEVYTTYMSSDERSFRHDRESLIRMFRKHLINETAFQDMLEEESIFWVDDLDLASSMVIKTIKNINEEDEEVDIMPVWRNDDDDKEFMVGLFTQTLAQGVLNEKLIKEGAQNWELERIALIDRILMKMALAEAKTFESIPLKVTLNEYIELSKYYSTEKSHGFINGILDQLFTSLHESGDIKKTGRGLI